jgi:hypothetical protein
MKIMISGARGRFVSALVKHLDEYEWILVGCCRATCTKKD